MIYADCQNYCGDDDCNKCSVHGYIYGCEDCPDYKDFFGNMPNKKQEEEDGRSKKG